MTFKLEILEVNITVNYTEKTLSSKVHPQSSPKTILNQIGSLKKFPNKSCTSTCVSSESNL